VVVQPRQARSIAHSSQLVQIVIRNNKAFTQVESTSNFALFDVTFVGFQPGSQIHDRSVSSGAWRGAQVWGRVVAF
jgi:hypothetical protein